MRYCHGASRAKYCLIFLCSLCLYQQYTVTYFCLSNLSKWKIKIAEDREQYHYLVARINMASFDVAKFDSDLFLMIQKIISHISLSVLNLLQFHIKTFWVKFSDTNSADSLFLTNAVLRYSIRSWSIKQQPGDLSEEETVKSIIQLLLFYMFFLFLLQFS